MHLARFDVEPSLYYLILGWGMAYPGEEIHVCKELYLKIKLSVSRMLSKREYFPHKCVHSYMTVYLIGLRNDFYSSYIWAAGMVLTSSMEQSPSWEATDCSAGKEIPTILLNPKVHYLVHQRPPLVHILSQINPAYFLPFYYLR
jgi:hypothetical protein